MIDLVKRLRDAWEYYRYLEQKDHTLLRHAADLIEQQQARIAELEATVERLRVKK